MSKSAPRARHLELVSSAPSSLPRYLHRRGRTYYFKRKIPSDVAKEFPNSQGQLWKSLDTPLLERAKVMLAVEVTEFDLKLARCRNERATQIARVAPLMRLVNGTSGESSFTGSSADDVSVALSAPAQEHFDLVRSIEASLERLRVLALPTVLPGQHTPRQSVPNGEAVAVANVQAKPNSRGRILPTMLHLFEDWCLKQTRPRTVGAVRKAVLEFRELHGPLPVENINRQHARDYRDVLIERKLSDGTIENRIGFLSTLMRHGLAEMVEHLTGNPFENIVINGGQGQRAPKDRRAFEVSELNTLFASRLYTQGYRPEGQAAEAAYWMPLLGPFIGARIEELAQLRVADVQRVNGVWCVRICDLDHDQTVKNSGSFRRVPLHESVVRCGFLAYVAAQSMAGAERVFPSLSNVNANKIWSNSLGKWWGRYLDTIGLSDPRLDYHSFRYCFRQQCSLCGIENETRDALTGHWLSNTDSGRTYMKAENRQYPYPKLATAMQLLRYDELRIAHLFVEAPMAGVEEFLLR